jgi:predicted DCC family thiol-disulfide oxidoreductase YuxK
LPRIFFTAAASEQLSALEKDKSQTRRLKAVRSALGKLELNLRHPGLQTHEFQSVPCPHGDKLYQAYAQNRTPGAYRIFRCYLPPPPRDAILIVAITPHP